MEPNQLLGSLVTLVMSGLVIVGSILLPVLLVLFVIRIARSFVTPQEKEMRRLLAEVVELLRENNRLLQAQSGNPEPNSDPKL